jgi:hypothetical protein
MKHCPECGERMRLGMGQWVHVEVAACRVVTLRATPEEVAEHARPAARLRPARTPQAESGRRFGHFTTDGPSAAPGR